tara:strand:- start:508 stop:621 length:114 start_codon:yes stop_codon:yes gene_type:complete
VVQLTGAGQEDACMDENEMLEIYDEIESNYYSSKKFY